MPDPRRTAARIIAMIGAPVSFIVAVALLMAPASATPVSSDSLSYFTDSDGAPKTTGTSSAPALQSVVTSNSGSLDSATSFPGAGTAADYPAFDGSSTAPRAVVAMTNTTATDVLTPLAKQFTFGADINSDQVNAGTTYDNGNNILQRGLFGDTAQYKIQVDHGYAMCRVKGAGGSISVTSTQLMPAGQWFRVACTRKVLATGDKLILDITPISAQGTLGVVVAAKSGIKKIGKLNFLKATPVSIGGKLTSTTAIHPESDQFNGLIDNPFIDIG